MEKKQLIKLAAKLIKECIHYVKNTKKDTEIKGTPFDVEVTEDGIYVFNATNDDTFYWDDECHDIVKGLGLTKYYTYDYDRKKVVCRIY